MDERAIRLLPQKYKKVSREGGDGWGKGWGRSVRIIVPLGDECFFPEAPLPWDLALPVGEQLTPFDWPRRGQVSASYRHSLWTAPTLDKPTLAW